LWLGRRKREKCSEEEDSGRTKGKVTFLNLTYLILKKKIFYIFLLVLYNYLLLLICGKRKRERYPVKKKILEGRRKKGKVTFLKVNLFNFKEKNILYIFISVI